MDRLAEKLDARLREWKPETAAEARERITEVIELANHDVLGVARSRAAEQEVLDPLDEPQPGEIWLAGLSLSAKTRPVVIVSLQDPDPPRALVLYVPLTTQRRNSPYEVPLPRLPFLDRESVANVQGLGSLPTVRLERKFGRLSTGVMEQLNDALAFALDLEQASE
jgi:mRNA interferase MazF